MCDLHAIVEDLVDATSLQNDSVIPEPEVSVYPVPSTSTAVQPDATDSTDVYQLAKSFSSVERQLALIMQALSGEDTLEAVPEISPTLSQAVGPSDRASVISPGQVSAPEEDIVDVIASSFDNEDLYGPPLDAKIAALVNKLVNADFSPKKIEELTKGLLLPQIVALCRYLRLTGRFGKN